MKTFVCVLLMLSGIALAEEPTGWPSLKVRDTEYKDVKVVSSDASSIKIIHQSGAARILIKDLPADVQQQFNYDPATAKANEAKLAEQRSADQASARKAEFAKEKSAEETTRLKQLHWQYMSLIVDRVVPGGLICYSHTQGGLAGKFAQDQAWLKGTGPVVIAEHTGYTPMFVEGVKGKFGKGDTLTGYGARDGVKEFDGETLQRWISKPDGVKIK